MAASLGDRGKKRATIHPKKFDPVRYELGAMAGELRQSWGFADWHSRLPQELASR
jgi:hypothetical protein